MNNKNEAVYPKYLWFLIKASGKIENGDKQNATSGRRINVVVVSRGGGVLP